MTDTGSRTSVSLVPLASIGAPALLLCYGLLRLVDGLDGEHGPDGWAWNVGHTCFLGAIVLFAALMVGLRRVLLTAAPRQRLLTEVPSALGLFGAVCFAFVILHDLFPALGDAVPVVDPARAVGPLLFQVGLLIPLVRAGIRRPPLLPAWVAVPVLIGFVLIAVDLNLLPLAAALILAGLLPLQRLR